MEVGDGSSWTLRMVPHGGQGWFFMEFKDGSSWRLDDGSSWRLDDGSSWRLEMVPHGGWMMVPHGGQGWFLMEVG